MAAAVLALPALARAQSTNFYIYGRVVNTADVYDSRHTCYTAEGQTGSSTRLLCAAINRLMVTDWNNARRSDLVMIPHRGLWGGADGSAATVAENTMGAFQAALAAGYRVLEIDAAMAGRSNNDNICPDADGDVFVGHYFSMLAAGGDVDAEPCQYTTAQLGQFHMRLRDGQANKLPSNALAKLGDVILWAKANQVLLMVDPKVPGLSTADLERDHYARIIRDVLYTAEMNGALENVAIKTTYNYAESLSNFPINEYTTFFAGRFLWSPIINKSSCMKSKALGPCTDSDTEAEIDTVTRAASEWRKATNDSKQIATYEVQLYNSDHWASQPFTVSGDTYSNLIDYVAHQNYQCVNLPWLCKRSAIWSVDAVSDKGTLSRDYAWKFIGNTVGQDAWKNDQRGNPFVTLGYGADTNGTGHGSALYTAVITDRPDLYYQFQIGGPQASSLAEAQDNQP